jgi:TM2 domain-containing membrane protein YozV
MFLIVFGVFGAHQFYLGRPWVGLFYLLTGGVCGLGVVFDFFTLPLQVWSVNGNCTKNHHCCTCGR